MKKIMVGIIALGALFIGLFFALKLYYCFDRARGCVGVQARKAAPRLTKSELVKRKAAWKHLKGELADEMKDFNGTVGLVIKDLRMNWEINSSKDKSIPSASVVKIPIMMSYIDGADDRSINLQSRITLKKSDIVAGSGPIKDEPAGKSFTIEELILPMVTESDNTATNLLIGYLGFDVLNLYFHRLGLRHTNLSRKMMDFAQRKKGVENYTTAGDMAYLLERLYRGKFINPAASRKCLGILASQKVNDRIPKYLPKGTLVAHKTGLENGICHDVGIVYTKNGAFLIAVLTQHHNKSAKASKQLISTLSLLTYNYLNNL